MCQVVNIRKRELQKIGFRDFEEWSSKPEHIYIGGDLSNYVAGTTRSKWSNPFSRVTVESEGSLEKYEKYIRESELFSQLSELDGKILGCWCKPNACHGDVLIRLRNEQLSGAPQAPCSVRDLLSKLRPLDPHVPIYSEEEYKVAKKQLTVLETPLPETNIIDEHLSAAIEANRLECESLYQYLADLEAAGENLRLAKEKMLIARELGSESDLSKKIEELRVRLSTYEISQNNKQIEDEICRRAN
jgi:hypothetical protein